MFFFVVVFFCVPRRWDLSSQKRFQFRVIPRKEVAFCYLLSILFSGLDSSSEELPVTKSNNGSIVIWFRARA